MKKYIKLWPVLAIVVLLSISLVSRIPLSINTILGTPNSTLINNCTMTLGHWNPTNSTSQKASLTSTEFSQIIKMLEQDKYIRFYGDRAYRFDNSDFYDINLVYTIDGEMAIYGMSILKHGLIIVTSEGEQKVYAFCDKDKASEIVSQIYKYAYERIG